jgi:hypothetical protein
LTYRNAFCGSAAFTSRNNAPMSMSNHLGSFSAALQSHPFKTQQRAGRAAGGIE